ncbi:hypothetical protein OS493_006166 [Desmophyllum pertusum]|uniref:Uncharacterized protein n=1 Tax=Desmophyllum pertusum TaxID=174260 RepID=A0A9X0A497_9CNID|nr:hypothetical protein OS493_006166 [Desmophyllum pertusum]
MQDRMNEFPDEDHMPSGDHNLDVLLERHDDAGDGNSDGIHVHGNEGNGMASGVDQMDSGRNMSIGNSEDSGGDMDGLSVNPNCDGSSAQTEPKAEEHTGVADSSNGGFMPNESCSSAVGSSELSASSALIAQP